VKVTGPLTLTMTMDKAYNPTWFTDNELSQLTPMPMAWDKTAAGASNCAAVVADCAKVYSYLDSQSKSLSTWVGSPLWSVVDGPWKLTSFNADGNSTFVPNPTYSGPVKATLAKFEELPFTTESAEYNVLQAGAAGAGQKIDVGYLPTTDAPNKPANVAVGSNPVNGYTLAPLIEWAINYFPLNFQSTTGNGPVNRQLYFRQALQYLMNQKAVIDGPLHGYGAYTVGSAPTPPRRTCHRRASRAIRSPTTRPRPRRCSPATAGTSCPTASPPAPTPAPGPASAGRASPRATSWCTTCPTRPGPTGSRRK
jgi:peptide/nickel transport system substrate-binding protein